VRRKKYKRDLDQKKFGEFYEMFFPKSSYQSQGQNEADQKLSRSENMRVYIHKNNQQSGPFEESQILEWLASGQLSPNDMVVRQGETQWQPLYLLFPHAARQQPIAFQHPSQAGSSVAHTINPPGKPNKGAGKLLLVLVGLFGLGIIGLGIVAVTFMNKPKTTVNPVAAANSSDANISSNNINVNSANTNKASPMPNYAELQDRLKEFAALKPPVKLEKNPALAGKVIVVEQKDRNNEYTLRMPSSSELSRYGLSSDRLAGNLAEVDTLIQIFCGKGREIGRFGPRMAYVPAYSNICNISVIDYRASKTIAQKTFVNGKKPAKIYVRDDEHEYILDPPTEDVEKYLSGLVKE
jgi:hypothetical protein